MKVKKLYELTALKFQEKEELIIKLQNEKEKLLQQKEMIELNFKKEIYQSEENKV